MGLIRTVLLLAAGAALPAALARGLEVRAARAAEAVKVDGLLAEPSWGLGWAYSLVTYEGKEAVHPTEIRVLYDDGRLYFAFVCREEHIDRLAAKETRHDGDVWKDDCVEVFLDPAARSESYYHFMANTLGTRAEERAVGDARDGSWNIDWEAAAAVDAGARAWTAEIAIPLAGLELPFDVKSTWRFNLNRERQAKAGTKAEFQGLVATPQGFHSPEKFAVLSGLDIDYFSYRAAALKRWVEEHSRACAELVREARSPEHPRPDLDEIRRDLAALGEGVPVLRNELGEAKDEAYLALLAERLGRRAARLAELRKRLRTRPERPDDELF